MPSSARRSAISGMRNPKVMASMKGGHFLTVICSVPSTVLKAFWGIVLNQSGSPSTAGIGRGRIGSSSGGQRKVIVVALISSIAASWAQIADPRYD